MKSPRNKLFLLFLAAIVLLLAAALLGQCYFKGRAPAGGLTAIPADWIPEQVPGWTVENLQYADTSIVAKSITENVGYDAFLYRKYTKGRREIWVDITYWRPRQRHFLDVGTHVPDNCWVANGWIMKAKLPQHSFLLPDKRPLIPSELRTFNTGERLFYSAFWHLLGNDRLDYTRYGTGKTAPFMWDNRRFFLKSDSPQFFINLMSNEPFSLVEHDPLFQLIIKNLSQRFPQLLQQQ